MTTRAWRGASGGARCTPAGRPSAAGTCRRDARRSRPGAVIVPSRRRARSRAECHRDGDRCARWHPCHGRRRATRRPPPLAPGTERHDAPSRSVSRADPPDPFTLDVERLPGRRQHTHARARRHDGCGDRATASSRCSQLSRMSNDFRNRRPVDERFEIGRDRGSMPSKPSSVGATRRAINGVERSEPHAVRHSVAWTRRPTSSANRVLPMPPTPVSVTTRRRPRCPTIDSRSSDRPTEHPDRGESCRRDAFAVRGGRGRLRTHSTRDGTAGPARSRPAARGHQDPPIVEPPRSPPRPPAWPNSPGSACPVRRVHHTSGAIDGRTEVVAIAFVSLPGVKSHSHAQRQPVRPRSPGEGGLRLDGDSDRVLGPRKHDSEAVPAGREDVTTMRDDRRSQDLVMRDERRTHRVRVLFPSRRRPLDIREEEGHRPRRGLSHVPQYPAPEGRARRQGAGRTNSASFTPWSAAIISAAFSPIMIAGRVRVAAHHVRHDARVGHAQPLDPHHPQPRVDDAPDPAGRRRVVHGPASSGARGPRGARRSAYRALDCARASRRGRAG